MDLKPLRDDLKYLIVLYQLGKKWEKVISFLQRDMRHPSLRVELLEPKWRGIYSFRIDKKYRALFFITNEGVAEIFQITNHYRKG